jgi:hypothetical protein
MLDYRIHYAVMASEDRVRSHRQQAQSEAAKRIFRRGGDRVTGRHGRH